MAKLKTISLPDQPSASREVAGTAATDAVRVVAADRVGVMSIRGGIPDVGGGDVDMKEIAVVGGSMSRAGVWA